MKSVVLYVCLTCILIFFAARIFAEQPQNFYDQLVTLYMNADKIGDLDALTGAWVGNCYSNQSPVDEENVPLKTEALIGKWQDTAPSDSPLQGLVAYKLQLRPESPDLRSDFYDFQSSLGTLPSIQEFDKAHWSPNTWQKYFDQPEIQESTGAEMKYQSPYLYLWVRTPTQVQTACYFRRITTGL